jgi:protoheme ferro-lyase
MDNIIHIIALPHSSCSNEPNAIKEEIRKITNKIADFMVRFILSFGLIDLYIKKCTQLQLNHALQYGGFA